MKRNARRRQSAACVVGAVAAAMVVVGCARQAEESSDDAAPRESSLSASYDPDGPVDPLVSAMQGNRTSTEVEELIEVAVAQCMAEQSLEYTARSFAPSEPLTRAEAYAYRQQHGFDLHLPSAAPVDSSNDPNLLRMQSMMADELARYLDALEGPDRSESVASGGCARVARDRVSANVPFLGTDQVAVLSDMRAELDLDAPQMIEATVAYAACMKTRGIDTGDPASTRRLALDSETFEDERALALGDLDCQAATIWPAWDLFQRS